MARRRRYYRNEPPPPAFTMGILWGLIGTLRTMPQFAGLLAPLQNTLQLLEEAMLFATLTALITFIFKVFEYIERGNIYRATRYTTQYMVTYLVDSAIDGLSSALGYIIGVKIGIEFAKVLATFPNAG